LGFAMFVRFALVVFFMGMGLFGLVRPRALVGIFGGDAPTAASRSEVRAVYGGFGLAVAACLATIDRWPLAARAGAYQCLAIGIGGMALGRVFGACVERDRRAFPTWVFVGVELCLAAALTWLGR
jgi:hypothetical protein